MVIPKDVRTLLGLNTGSKLMLITSHDMIVLQKVEVFGERLKIGDVLQKAKSLAQRLGIRGGQ